MYLKELEYRISSNNSPPSINHPPPLSEIFKIIASLKYSPSSPSPLAIFFSFYSLPVKLRCNVIQHNNWSVTIQAMTKELNLEELKSPCSVYLMWLFFDLMGK